MGSTAHVLLGADDARDERELLDDVQQFIEGLEGLWSRFRPSSELSRINARNNIATPVSRLTFDLIDLAIDAWRWTAGRFDPSIGKAMVRCGYDRSFDEIGPDSPFTIEAVGPADGCAEVELDERDLTIRVPQHLQLDLGGIGKGRAADLAVERLERNGTKVACVNLGGDLRCIGGDAFDGGWVVDVEDPFDVSTSVSWLGLTDGAVATSARTRRHWTTSRGEMHHLLDPSTGRPARSGLAQATVVAANAVSAEVLAKAAFLAGPDEGRLMVDTSGAAGLFVTDAGAVLDSGPIERFRR